MKKQQKLGKWFFGFSWFYIIIGFVLLISKDAVTLPLVRWLRTVDDTQLDSYVTVASIIIMLFGLLMMFGAIITFTIKKHTR